ncbi:MAG: hypothetical protein PHD91_00180 [bacterium]|nr:hypothetical protein [bacterium]
MDAIDTMGLDSRGFSTLYDGDRTENRSAGGSQRLVKSCIACYEKITGGFYSAYRRGGRWL